MKPNTTDTIHLNYLDGYNQAIKRVLEIIHDHEEGLTDALLCRTTFDALKLDLHDVFQRVETNHKIIESLTLEEFLNQWKTSSFVAG